LKQLRLVVTGNPGVGKHTVARIIAKRLRADVIDINQVALEGAAVSGKKDEGLDVDVKKLRALIGKMLLASKGFVIIGHLAPYVVRRADVSIAAVLRRSPYALEQTLEGRGYSFQKVRENVASEILGVSMYDAIKTFGKPKVAEFDTTGKSPEQTASEVIATLRGKLPKQVGKVEWLSVISDKDDIRRFFDY
jgi:adenylate kinase